MWKGGILLQRSILTKEVMDFYSSKANIIVYFQITNFGFSLKVLYGGEWAFFSHFLLNLIPLPFHTILCRVLLDAYGAPLSTVYCRNSSSRTFCSYCCQLSFVFQKRGQKIILVPHPKRRELIADLRQSNYICSSTTKISAGVPTDLDNCLAEWHP